MFKRKISGNNSYNYPKLEVSTRHQMVLYLYNLIVTNNESETIIIQENNDLESK